MNPSNLRSHLAMFKAKLDASVKTIPGGMGMEDENIERWSREYALVRVRASVLVIHFVDLLH